MTDGKRKGNGKKLFAPGNPGGPGRPPLPPVLKDVRRLTKTEFEAVANKYLWCSLEELERLATDKSLPVMEAWMVAVMFKGISTGEWGGQEWLAQRLMGKVRDQLEVKHVTPFVIRHTSGETTTLGAAVKELPDDDSDR